MKGYEHIKPNLYFFPLEEKMIEKEMRYYEGAAKDKSGLRYVLESDKTYMLQDKSGDLVFYTERYILDKVFEDIFKNLLGI